MTGTGELPVGVVIRTPPGSPSRQLAVIGPPEGLCLSPEQVTPTSHVNLQGILQVESLNWDINAGHLEPAQVEISRFRNLRKNIPFNRFMSEFLKNGEFFQRYDRLRTLFKANFCHPNSKITSFLHHVVSRTVMDPRTSTIWRQSFLGHARA